MVNLFDVVVDDAGYGDLDIAVVPTIFVSELLIGNDSVDDADVDHLGDVVCWLLPVDVVVELLVVEVDVRVVVFPKLLMMMNVMLLL